MVGPLTALLALWAQAAEADQEAATPAQGELSCSRWQDETRILAKPEWITHVVRPRERLAQVAARYGVTKHDLAAWNKLSSPRARVRAGKKLRLKTTRVPPPREKIAYAVAEGDDWSEVAIRHRVAIEDLKAWNSKHRGRPLEVGAELRIWIDPGEPRTVNCARGEPPPALEYRDDAVSLGHPQSGRLKNGIRLPEWPLWTKGNPRGLYASSHTLDVMVAALTQLRVDNGYDGAMFIGSISKRRGGYFPPHRSHRTGLDIDIRLPLLPAVPPETYPTPDNVDWPALWELIEAFVDTGEVSMIFLDHRMQKYLYRAARWEGKTPEELESIIHWPRKDRKWEVIVRHSRGHKGHIHVRLLCGPDEPRCGPKREKALERRGWIEPHPSAKESREGARERREQWKLEGRLTDDDEGEDEDE
jgi:hypothetical protein